MIKCGCHLIKNNYRLPKLDKSGTKIKFMKEKIPTFKVFIDYLSFHQQLNSDTDAIIKAYYEFISQLNKNHYKLIAIREEEGKRQEIEITLDENKKITEIEIIKP